MSTEVGRILEASSRDTVEGDADPKMLRYRTLIVSSDHISEVIKDINFLAIKAEVSHPLLRPLLRQRCKSYEYAVASHSSIGGAMLKMLQTQRTEYSVRQQSTGRSGMGLRELLQGGNKGGDE